MFDPPGNRHQPADHDYQQKAHMLEQYLDAFRPVLTDTEIEDIERRIQMLRHQR